MGLFGQSPFEADIEKATSEKNTTEPWGLIMDVCDKVTTNPKNAKECLKVIMRRMANNDPHVVIQAITLLDACVNNCGKPFHLEVASREFENEFKRLLIKAQPQVATKMRLLLKKWAENDFKSDQQLVLIPSLYHKLKSEGHDFSDNQKASKSATPAAALKDPNVVTSQQEEEDIAKAIELSLKETKNSPKKQTTTTTNYSSLYPSFSGGAAALGATVSAAVPVTSAPEPRKVRALYDFEAAEENELTFNAGEIIHVLDDSDPNWWKGYNQRGEGLFPSNFVTADLSVEPEKFDANQKTKKSVQFDDEAKKDEKTDISKLEDDKTYVPEINEEKIDRLLHLLHEANPEDPSQDSDEMLRLEEEVNKMGPLIDAELERVDRKHAQLTQLSSDLVDAINLYHTLMREPDRSTLPPSNLGGAMNFMPGMPPNMYGPVCMYDMGSMYPQNVPNSMAPTSLPAMPMMHMMAGPHPSTQQPGQPPQMPVIGNTQAGYGPHPQQMIPMQFQNGHQGPPHQQQSTQQPQPQQQHPQPQQQQQPQQQPQQLNQAIPNQTTSVGQQIPSQLPQQQLPTSTQHNVSSFLPTNSMPGYVTQPSPYIPHLSTIAPGAFHVPPQMMPNGPLNNMMGQPQAQLPLNSQSPMSLPQMSMTLPVTHTLLGQNESKTNIPVHQQQR